MYLPRGKLEISENPYKKSEISNAHRRRQFSISEFQVPKFYIWLVEQWASYFLKNNRRNNDKNMYIISLLYNIINIIIIHHRSRVEDHPTSWMKPSQIRFCERREPLRVCIDQDYILFFLVINCGEMESSLR